MLNDVSRSLPCRLPILLLAALLLLPMTPAVADGGVTFTDIAAGDAAGITYRRTESPRNELFDAIKAGSVFTMMQLPMVPLKGRGVPGVAILDFDRDGDLDIYVTNGPGTPNSLYSSQLTETGEMDFVDVGLAAGVGAVDQDSAGVCFGDIDNDGDHDLMVLGTSEPNRLFENNGDGSFTDITLASGIGGGDRNASTCSMGDVNGDGLLDVVVSNTFTDFTHQLAIFVEPFAFNEHNQLFLNLGGNTFADVSAEAGLESLGGFPPEAAGAAGLSWAIAMVDYDLDGDIDIVSADDQGAVAPVKYDGVDRGFLQIFNNDGSGHFTNVTVAAGTNLFGSWMGLSFGDVNCDGYMDLFGSNVGDYMLSILPLPHELGDLTSRWLLGRPDGTFADPGVGELSATPFGWGTSMADYDNDGDTDIVFHGGLDNGMTIDASNPGSLLRNQGCSGNFVYDREALAGSTDHGRRNVEGMAMGDLDGNGFVDIVSVSNFDIPEPLPQLTYPVDYTSPFDAEAAFTPNFVPTEVPGEFTWSGVVTPDGTLSVELNSGGNGNASATIELMGTAGMTKAGRVNRDGIGAVVSFTPLPGGATVMRPVVGGASYASQDALPGLFGLGGANRGVAEVLWPGGTRNRLYNVRAGSRVLFPEIPCSFDDPDLSATEHLLCVLDHLDELMDAGAINTRDRARFLLSAFVAYNSAH